MNASVVVVASNLYVEMVETIVQSIESKHLWIFTIWGSSSARPLGRTHFQKTHPKQNEPKYLDFIEVQVISIPHDT